MNQIKLVLFILITLIVFACKEKTNNITAINNWTYADRQEFLTECNINGALSDYCDCALNDVEKTFPDVNEIDRNYEKVENHILTVTVTKCADQIYGANLKNSPNLNSGIYEKSERELFIDECNLDGEMYQFCDCAYDVYKQYGYEYYMKNMDRVLKRCEDYLY
tara:strand:+ start:72 stop:563 length:492 start_codon:yes stop_codon:yes gene_type:complete